MTTFTSPIAYHFAVIRYVHDIVTGEYINVGISLVAPSIGYANIKCRHTFGRIVNTFPNVKGTAIKSRLRHIECIFKGYFDPQGGFVFEENLEKIMLSILPRDDSSIQWDVVGSGVSFEIDETFEALFDRYVCKYDEKNHHNNKSDEDVWRNFKKDLISFHLLEQLQPYRIETNDDALSFDFTLKNGVLHCLEPLSFDLTTAEGIKDKARSWLGKITSVAKSKDTFEVYYMVGRPSDNDLMPAFSQAINILRTANVPTHIFYEYESEKLGMDLNRKINHLT